jgi:hypothetical protein
MSDAYPVAPARFCHVTPHAIGSRFLSRPQLLTRL